jgi:DNA-binding transcriptional LysR family regulator
MLEDIRALVEPADAGSVVKAADQLAFVAAGYGLGFVPARFLRSYPNRRELRAIQVPDLRLKMTVAFVQAGRLGSLERGPRARSRAGRAIGPRQTATSLKPFSIAL